MILFDTSVIVPALLSKHPAHAVAIHWYDRIKKDSVVACVCQHALAETFNAITSLPEPYKFPPSVARQLIRDFSKFVTIVDLNQTDYSIALDRLANSGMSGGIVYDMLHLIAAEKVGAIAIVTGNLKHFHRLPAIVHIEILDFASADPSNWI